MKLAKTLMIQGTASDVGKSVLTAALCRTLAQDGWRVAPFKSQNMSLNSYATPDGKEIGRAQGMQADACGIPATTDMNPILLKPSQDMTAQVVVHGKPYRDLDARTYWEKYLPEAARIVREALDRLRRSFDAVLLEGAGSPAEINLKDRDIVNMRMASWADAPVLLVADIDRGGVFASIVGTLELLEPEERDRVRGLIINKFRGDVSLLAPGLEWLERRTGKPVLGVIPYLPNLNLEDEDSASLNATPGEPLPLADGRLDLAVIRLPRISNFTDFDPFRGEPDVRLRYVARPEEFGAPDAVILPGSKNTVENLRFLRETGLADRLLAHVRAGGRLAGICAGYQMLGERLADPHGVETAPGTSVPGLGLFPAETTFSAEKRTVRAEGFAALAEGEPELPVEGYEIHMGRTSFREPVRHPFRLRPIVGPSGPSGEGAAKRRAAGSPLHAGSSPCISNPHAGNPPLADAPASDAGAPYVPDGAATADGRVWGTYLHGVFQNDEFRRRWLNAMRADKGWPALPVSYSYRERREAAFDRLAAHVRAHLDMERVYAILSEGWKGSLA